MATPKKKQQEIPTPQVEARIDRLVDGDFKTKAYASATIGGAFAVHGIRVIESDKGRFISMPQDSYKKNGETKYDDSGSEFFYCDRVGFRPIQFDQHQEQNECHEMTM